MEKTSDMTFVEVKQDRFLFSFFLLTMRFCNDGKPFVGPFIHHTNCNGILEKLKTYVSIWQIKF